MQAVEKKLGFDSVRALVSAKCATDGARRLVDQTGIMHSADDITAALKPTDEMRLVCMFEDTFPDDGFVDMRPFLLPLTSEDLDQPFPADARLFFIQGNMENVRAPIIKRRVEKAAVRRPDIVIAGYRRDRADQIFVYFLGVPLLRLVTPHAGNIVDAVKQIQRVGSALWLFRSDHVVEELKQRIVVVALVDTLEYLKKGQKVAVNGRFRFAVTQDESGKSHVHLNVSAYNVELCGPATRAGAKAADPGAD